MKKIRANIYWENFQLIDMVSIQWKKLSFLTRFIYSSRIAFFFLLVSCLGNIKLNIQPIFHFSFSLKKKIKKKYEMENPRQPVLTPNNRSIFFILIFFLLFSCIAYFSGIYIFFPMYNFQQAKHRWK